MFSTLLVPMDLDRPDVSRPAVETACEIARAWHGTVHAMTVASLWSGLTGSDAARLEEAVAAYVARFPGRIEPVLKLGGDVPSRIVDAAAEIGADLVVMATHDPTPSDRLWGSNAAYVALHAEASVLVVRGAALLAPRTVLVPVDLADPASADRAMEVAVAIATEMGARDAPARLLVLSVLLGTGEAEARSRLASWAETHAKGGVAPEFIFREGGPVAPTIREVAAREDVDLVVMTTHESRASDAFLGSNARSVALHGATSVLVVR